jgi:hypothetical protein
LVERGAAPSRRSRQAAPARARRARCGCQTDNAQFCPTCARRGGGARTSAAQPRLKRNAAYGLIRRARALPRPARELAAEEALRGQSAAADRRGARLMSWSSRRFGQARSKSASSAAALAGGIARFCPTCAARGGRRGAGRPRLRKRNRGGRGLARRSHLRLKRLRRRGVRLLILQRAQVRLTAYPFSEWATIHSHS